MSILPFAFVLSLILSPFSRSNFVMSFFVTATTRGTMTMDKRSLSPNNWSGNYEAGLTRTENQLFKLNMEPIQWLVCTWYVLHDKL